MLVMAAEAMVLMAELRNEIILWIFALMNSIRKNSRRRWACQLVSQPYAFMND